MSPPEAVVSTKLVALVCPTSIHSSAPPQPPGARKTRYTIPAPADDHDRSMRLAPSGVAVSPVGASGTRHTGSARWARVAR